jgi:uncharacterized protein (TIGR02453 family)
MNFTKIFDFLKNLEQNNNRPWFDENKETYEAAKSDFEQFIDVLIPRLKEFDDDIDVFSSKECIFRIYRDVRFSKNKDPYKTNFGAYIVKGGRKSPYAGYYVHIQPSESFIGGGIYQPSPEVLKSVRKEIYENIDEFKEIINDARFKKYFPELYGEALKTAPKDFPKDFPDIDLLKFKHYTVIHNIKDSFYSSPDLLEKLIEIFKVQYPFNRFLNEGVGRKK